MSGGSLDYFCYKLSEHVGDFGDKELDDLVKDLAYLFHNREWYLSGDYGIGNWRKSRDEFKKKWFTPENRQIRMEKYLKEIEVEIKEKLGIMDSYCRDCIYWKSEGNDSEYGKCEKEKSCLMHECDSCEKFKKKLVQESS